MKKMKLMALLMFSCLLIISVNLKGQSATGWRGENRNGTIKGFNIPDKWPVELKKGWQIKVGESDASPVLSNGRIYLLVKIDNNEKAVCLDAANGTELWRTTLNPSPNVTGPA